MNEPRKGMKSRWSLGYKKSINCNHPRGFSQKNYCKRQKRGGRYMEGFKDWVFKEDIGGIYRVYHGGLWDGKKPLRVNGKGALGVGAYFTGNLSRAIGYAKESGGGNVVEVEIELRKPLIIEGKILNRQLHGSIRVNDPVVEALVKLGLEEKVAAEMVEKVEERYGYIGEQIKNRALAQGYDGLIQLNPKNNSEINELVVWYRQVVKRIVSVIK